MNNNKYKLSLKDLKIVSLYFVSFIQDNGLDIFYKPERNFLEVTAKMFNINTPIYYIYNRMGLKYFIRQKFLDLSKWNCINQKKLSNNNIYREFKHIDMPICLKIETNCNNQLISIDLDII